MMFFSPHCHDCHHSVEQSEFRLSSHLSSIEISNSCEECGAAAAAKKKGGGNCRHKLSFTAAVVVQLAKSGPRAKKKLWGETHERRRKWNFRCWCSKKFTFIFICETLVIKKWPALSRNPIWQPLLPPLLLLTPPTSLGFLKRDWDKMSLATFAAWSEM